MDDLYRSSLPVFESSWAFVLLFLILAIFSAAMTDAAAQESASTGKSGGWPEISYDFSIAPFYQPSADIDGRGDFDLSSAFVRFKASTLVSRRTILGLQLKYDIDDYGFGGNTEFGGVAPWNDARRFGIGLSILTRLSDHWSLGISPSINWLQEYGADSNESLSYGATTFVLKSFGRKKSIGLGAGVFREIDDDTRVFPFIAVDWRFNERWRISNPFDADVLGPAGLELMHSFNDRWRLGAGGVYRSFQFRLDDEGVEPNGIGKNEGFVGFFRLRRSGKSSIDLDFYVGATFDGELELMNQNGDGIASSGYETAPFVALALSGSF